MKIWRLFEREGCPRCGGDLEVYVNSWAEYAEEDDPIKCTKCSFRSYVVDNTYIAEGNKKLLEETEYMTLTEKIEYIRELLSEDSNESYSHMVIEQQEKYNFDDDQERIYEEGYYNALNYAYNLVNDLLCQKNGEH